MNTGERNVYGRTIWRGPRGGEYTINPLTGRQVRQFRRAEPAAAAPVVNTSVPGFTRTRFVAHKFVSRHVYKKNSSGRYYAVSVQPNGRPKDPLNAMSIARHENVTNERTGVIKKLSEHLKSNAAPAAAAPGSPAPTKMMAKAMKMGSNTYLTKTGYVKNHKGMLKWRMSNRNVDNLKRTAFARDPKYLKKNTIPYIKNENATALATKHKLKNGLVYVATPANTGWQSRIFFNKDGNLYYGTLNGRKVRVTNTRGPLNFQITNPATLRKLKRAVGERVPNYPRAAIPPATPVARRTSPELMNNMITQIYEGGRGSNINAGRYTAEERNVLARKLTESIDYFKQHRNAKKAEAAEARNALRNMNTGSVGARLLRNRIAAATERVGYYDDAVRAYTRGLRAVKPLTGNVTPRARAMAATPNRFTPAPANVNVNAVYANLERPHLVVKTPGAGGTIYLNPATFVGLMRNAARVNKIGRAHV